jgi:undecaprenyl-diphosphatase
MVPSWLQAVVLGILQGLTEFIPVSSSGHLVLVPYLLAWDRPGLAFDVALHVGTAGAVIAYFRRELWAMATGLVRGGRTPAALLYRRLFVLLAAGSVPVAIVGLTLEDFFVRVFETPPAAAGFLFVTAGVLWGIELVRDRRVGRTAQRDATIQQPDRRALWEGDSVGPTGEQTENPLDLPTGADPTDPAGLSLERIGLPHALTVGVFQCLALLPGVSRSGITIFGGVATGLTREAATRFSFLLALPAFAGAAIVSLGDLAEPGPYSIIDIALGVLAAFAAGYLAIRFLIALVSRDRLTGFARYCVAAGLVGLAGYAMIG